MKPAAAYAVDTTDGLILVDSGLEANAAQLSSQLAELRLDVKRLRAILLTHAHGDHVLGAAQLRARTGAKVYAGRGDCQPIREGGPREAFFSTFHMPNDTPHPTPVDVELSGGETLTFGEVSFRALATPGHTPGSVSYLMKRDGLTALFTGDVVQSLSRASPSFLGTYAAYLPPLYRGNARDYLGSLRRLRELPVPDLVLPGHPRMDETPQNPRLGDAGWHALLDAGIAEMEKLLKRYQEDGEDFLDGRPKELLSGLHYLGDVGESSVYCLLTAKGLLLFDAPGGSRLVHFLTERFHALNWGERKVAAVFLTSAAGEETTGLDALVRHTGCQVVAPKGGLEAVRALCPAGTDVIDGEQFQQSGWLEGRVIPLGGRGAVAQACEFRWANKSVLVSGRIPVKPSVPSMQRLVADVAGVKQGRSAEYHLALDRLAQVRPDLWLPAVPVHGQNANLYERDWEMVIEMNRWPFPR
jgi:glyoxylase-like metal-dependent hydrolase (beta-lactamase superfamily II)